MSLQQSVVSALSFTIPIYLIFSAFQTLFLFIDYIFYRVILFTEKDPAVTFELVNEKLLFFTGFFVSSFICLFAWGYIVLLLVTLAHAFFWIKTSVETFLSFVETSVKSILNKRAETKAKNKNTYSKA